MRSQPSAAKREVSLSSGLVVIIDCRKASLALARQMAACSGSGTASRSMSGMFPRLSATRGARGARSFRNQELPRFRECQFLVVPYQVQHRLPLGPVEDAFGDLPDLFHAATDFGTRVLAWHAKHSPPRENSSSIGEVPMLKIEQFAVHAILWIRHPWMG